MAYTIEIVDKNLKFKNVHGNYYEPFVGIVRLFNDPGKNGFDAYNATSESVMSIISEALSKNTRLRACGSLWSLSRVPYVNGLQIFSRDEADKQSMKFYHFLDHLDLEEKVDVTDKAKSKEFLFSQCGNTIKDLNEICKNNGRSLKTSGASNGQTIAGAVGTGVHGSSLYVGSLSDTVYGLHIITGTGPEDSIYLEPADRPVASEAFASKINARLVRDNKQFYAALVGLGAFGYVHGVLVQTDGEYQLSNFIKKVDISKVYDFLDTIDVKDNGLNIEGMNPEDLFHVKFYINQYRLTDNVRAEIIYKSMEMRPLAIPVFLQYNKDFQLTIGKLFSSIFRFLIPGQIDSRLPKDGESETGSIGEIFKETTNLRDGQFSCAVAVDKSASKKFLKLALQLADNHKKVPATFSLRFVKKSKATLAFTKFDMNCIFGLDGIETGLMKNFLEELTQKLIEDNVPHAWHWGKFNFMNRDSVENAYGKKKDQWLSARKSLFKDPAVAQAFTNDYLHDRGLS